MRNGFTIIEILVSVIIISISIIMVLRIYDDNRSHILYITERNKQALSDSLFLGKEILREHKEKVNGYELLQPYVRIDELATKELLKNLKRDVFIPDEIIIAPPPEIPGPTAIVHEVKLKGEYPSFYWHFRITSF